MIIYSDFVKNYGQEKHLRKEYMYLQPPDKTMSSLPIMRVYNGTISETKTSMTKNEFDKTDKNEINQEGMNLGRSYGSGQKQGVGKSFYAAPQPSKLKGITKCG